MTSTKMIVNTTEITIMCSKLFLSFFVSQDLCMFFDVVPDTLVILIRLIAFEVKLNVYKCDLIAMVCIDDSNRAVFKALASETSFNNFHGIRRMNDLEVLPYPSRISIQDDLKFLDILRKTRVLGPELFQFLFKFWQSIKALHTLVQMYLLDDRRRAHNR